MSEFAPVTIRRVLERGRADAVAIAAPDRPALTYADLRRHAEETVGALNRLGIGRNDRVAVVLPNGPEMAAAFVTIAAGASAAPLNPAYREEEFTIYFSLLRPKLVVVPSWTRGEARAVAGKLGIPLAELHPRAGSAAGLFDLHGEAAVAAAPAACGYAEPDDVGLLLHTSGTTARPKIVPLSHRNLGASAANIARSLSLTPEDRCLNIMPLFHIHGLTAALLASLTAGASIWCSPGFNALAFFAWMCQADPTWYTAVPTMHQAILSRARRHQEDIRHSRLRLVRSSSASLPPQVMQTLEETFGVPAVEAYGMTEAAHQIACNPLPPRMRKPGSVGLPAGPVVAVLNDAGRPLPAGAIGEVAIRGPNVANGYQDDPAATATAFREGWFHTGDQGRIDDDGYLWLTGRLKEIINRGGEKFSPREVDEVLIDHPAVAQAVTFAVPHKKLGEEVAAAVVLRAGATVTAHDLREFADHRLSHFKVPRKVYFLDEIPKGPTGKPQRVGLATTLGLTE